MTLFPPAQASSASATHSPSAHDLRQLVEAMADAIVIVDDAGFISMTNSQAETLFGYSANELLGQPLNLLLPERFRERHQSLVAHFMRYPHARAMGSGLALVGRRRDGREIPLEISLGPLVIAGQQRIVAAVRDITERRKAEQAQEEFIESAAHALRTPIAALRGYVDTLVIHTARGKGPSLAEWQNDAIEQIGRATERLEALSMMLIDVTRIQADHLSLRLEPHDLAALIRRVISQVRRGDDRHIITVRTPTKPVIVSIDARRIEQTLRYLLANAMKYSPNAGAVAVTLRRRPQSGGTLVEVRDHGVGIAPDLRARLFTRFGSQANDAGAPGTGLGLYLSQYFIERHGGQIDARSTQGKGTTFWFTLPRDRNADEERHNQSRRHNHHGR